jgi:hypothetical protein
LFATATGQETYQEVRPSFMDRMVETEWRRVRERIRERVQERVREMMAERE